jgi:glycosyltransferase involved in cell wall biosynthesis
MPFLSVVVPVFNERDNVLPLIAEITAALRGKVDFEIVYVDDASRDDTVSILKAAKAANPELRVLQHHTQSGQSTAIRNGVKAARGEWIATLDGDGQNDPADIPKLLTMRNESSESIKLFAGWRVNRQDSGSKRWASKWAECDPQPPAQGRNPGHRLRYQAVRTCRFPRPALLRPHAPLPARPDAARRLAGEKRAGQPPCAQRRQFQVQQPQSRPGRHRRPARRGLADSPLASQRD